MNEIAYKTISGRNFVLIPCAESGKNIETQIRMLSAGEMSHILKVVPTAKNGVPILQYDITGLTRLDSITQYGKLSHEQFGALVDGLCAAMEECASYALSPNGICFEDDCIFFDTKANRVQLVYIPTLQEGDPETECRDLLRSLIAYGKVEYGTLTAMVNDAINNPAFSFYLLKELPRRFGAGQDARPAGRPSAPPPRAESPAPEPPFLAQEEHKSAPAAANLPPAFAPPPLPQAAPFAPPAVPPPTAPQTGKAQKAKTKSVLGIVLIVVLSIAAIAGACFTPVVRLPTGGFDITKLLGVGILIAALDFLLLRKLLAKAPAAEQQTPQTGKPGEKGGAVAMNAPKAPFAPPPPAAQSRKNAPGPAPSPAAPPVYTAVSPVQESGEETVLFEEPAVSGALYIQTADGELVTVTKSPFLLGRDRAVSDYTLDDKTVGRKHAELSRQGNGWVIVDQNSRNHTFLNDACLNPYTPYPLSDGDVVRLAKTTLWIKAR